MKIYQKTLIYFVSILVIGMAMNSCQKMDRPKLPADYPQDPPPPPYSILKDYWSFDGNVRDTGQYRAVTTAKNVTYVDGAQGQAAQIGDAGYIVAPVVDDSLKTPGSLTIAFWMKGATGPVQGGAQGIFAISNSTQFWGNVEIFLENYKDDADPNAVFMKIHLFNANVAGGGEVWLQSDDVKLKDVLGKWTHIALTYDASTSKISLYKDGAPTGVNGMELGNGNYGDLKFDNMNGLVIGSFAFQTDPSLTNHGPEGWAKSFNGALDNFRIYNKSLSAADIKNLYDNKM
jgi:hypothetical protein